ncbi:MAG: DUF3823 domain-containing protein [Tannerella sp.]|jgi:hypothetical protein|nr:DUF3823 domain-containing protein [Tannerella sp.]
MKQTIIYMATLFALTVCFSCVNELDNYDAPNGGVYGTVVDRETGQPVPLPVQGSTGIIIRLMEQGTSATQTVDFYAKHDGTFENGMVFNCDYLITVDGPFAEKGEVRATVKGQTKVDIPVLPYARIDATASVSGKVVTVNYKVQPTGNAYTVSGVYGYWNFAPGVDNGTANQAGKVTVTETEGTIVFDLTDDATYNSNLYKIRANQNKIYVRIGASTEGFINYSQTITLTVQ